MSSPPVLTFSVYTFRKTFHDFLVLHLSLLVPLSLSKCVVIFLRVGGGIREVYLKIGKHLWEQFREISGSENKGK